MKISEITSNKRKEVVIGVFFITATISAIIGMVLYRPILNNIDYIISGSQHSTQIVFGAVFELILAISATGTGIMLFPHLKKYDESWALGYVCFRLLEVVFILIGILSILSLLGLSQAYVNEGDAGLDSFQTAGIMLKTIHSWTFILGPHFMLGINTFIYSYIFYHSKLVPKNLSILGITGALLILIAAILELFGIIPKFSNVIIIFALPIAIYEMILAGWLIAKGFHYETIKSI